MFNSVDLVDKLSTNRHQHLNQRVMASLYRPCPFVNCWHYQNLYCCPRGHKRILASNFVKNISTPNVYCNWHNERSTTCSQGTSKIHLSIHRSLSLHPAMYSLLCVYHEWIRLKQQQTSESKKFSIGTKMNKMHSKNA